MKKYKKLWKGKKNIKSYKILPGSGLKKKINKSAF